MSYLNRRGVMVVASIIFLALLTALGIYAFILIRNHSIPIPNGLSTLTIAIPAIVGIIIESLRSVSKTTTSSLSNRHSLVRSTQSTRAAATIRTPILTALLTLLTVLTTLSANYLAPSDSLTCNLQTSWQRLWQTRDSPAIRAIQDGLECCGFRSTSDMPYPFPGGPAHVPVTRCVETFGRMRACLEPWRAEMQRTAGWMALVNGMTMIWMGVVVVGGALRNRNEPGLFSLFRGRGGDRRSRAALEFGERDDEENVERYRDDPLARERDATGGARRAIREVRHGNEEADESESGLVPGLVGDQDQWGGR